MPTSILLEGLAAKVESTYGTDATPDPASDAIRVADRLWTGVRPVYAFPNTREDVATSGLIEAPPGLPAGRLVETDVVVELTGAGAAYSSATPVRPPVDPLLVAAGLGRTHTDTGGSESVAYSPADTGHASATIYIWAGGKLFKLVGCRTSIVWPGPAGGQGRLNIRIQGFMVSDPTEVALPAFTYVNQLAPVAKGMGIALDAWALPNVREFEFDLGAEVQRLDDANAAEAIEGFFITRFRPTYRLSARTVALGTFDPYAHQKNRTVVTITQTLGSTQYNQVKLNSSEARLFEAEHSDDGGFTGWDLTFQLRNATLTFD